MEQSKEKTGVGGRALDIIAIVLCVILIPILIINGTLIVKGLINPDKVPSFLGFSPMVVQTDSMYPVFEAGDLIFVKTTEPQEVRVGDVISFFDPSSSSQAVVTHRVADITVGEDGQLSFITKGDANNTEDADPVKGSELVGCYISHIKGLGKLVMFMQTTAGVLICVLITALLIGLTVISNNRKNNRKREEETKALKEELEALRAAQKNGQ